MSHTSAGLAITKFSIATSESWNDKATGDKKEKTEWHRIVAFSKLAEICGKYLHKGKQIYIEGRLQTNMWEKDGVKRYSTEIIANNMQMLGAKGDRQEQQTQSNSVPLGEPSAPVFDSDDSDDSVPF